jgi:hypothetical protein
MSEVGDNDLGQSVGVQVIGSNRDEIESMCEALRSTGAPVAPIQPLGSTGIFRFDPSLVEAAQHAYSAISVISTLAGAGTLIEWISDWKRRSKRGRVILKVGDTQIELSDETDPETVRCVLAAALQRTG